MSDAQTYTPENDITQEQANGTTVLLAAAGVPMPMAEARARGFVKAPQPQGGRETKAEDGPAPEPATEPAPRGRKAVE